MRSLPSMCGIATAVMVLSATTPSALAQENTAALTCQTVGWEEAARAAGDREAMGSRL